MELPVTPKPQTTTGQGLLAFPDTTPGASPEPAGARGATPVDARAPPELAPGERAKLPPATGPATNEHAHVRRALRAGTQRHEGRAALHLRGADHSPDSQHQDRPTTIEHERGREHDTSR